MPAAPRVLDVLLVDGDPLALRALTRALQADPGLRVAATALDVAQALAGAARRPDVAVVDPWLGGQGGPQVVGRLHAVAPAMAILVVASVEDQAMALEVLRLGASGYLPKQASPEVLPRAVHALARGEAVVTRALTSRLLERLRTTPEPGPGLRPVRSVLSSREWEVLDLLVEGAGTQEIADDLELAPETVRSHIKRILRKLGTHSRAEAVVHARLLLRQDAPERAGP